MLRAALVLLVLMVASPGWAQCPTGADFRTGGALHLLRKTPHFEVTLTQRPGGIVHEDRVMLRDGKTETTHTNYLHGLFTVRRVGRSIMTVDLAPAFAEFDPSKVGATIDAPITLTDGGRKENGRQIAEVTQRAEIKIGKCRYPVTVIRMSLVLDGRGTYNNEASYQPDLGVILSNITMSKDWVAQSGVLFDRIELVK